MFAECLGDAGRQSTYRLFGGVDVAARGGRFSNCVFGATGDLRLSGASLDVEEADAMERLGIGWRHTVNLGV